MIASQGFWEIFVGVLILPPNSPFVGVLILPFVGVLILPPNSPSTWGGESGDGLPAAEVGGHSG